MEHTILALSVSCFFSSLSFEMAAPSFVNINFSAKIDLNLSVSVMLPMGQAVDVSGPEIAKPTGCKENLALTNMSDVNENSENDSELMSEAAPVERRSMTLGSDNQVSGPFTDEALARLASAFAAIFESQESPVLASDCLPLSSPASPSFSEINPDDLIWVSLPEIDLDDFVVECPMETDDEIVVEIIESESDQDDGDVVFIKEIRRSGTKAE